MREDLLQILFGTVGTLGFSLFFGVRIRHLPVATLGGALTWALYLLVRNGTGKVFISSLVASMGICFYSEIMARVRKAPANVFLMPGTIPLLPGGALYYTMAAIVEGDLPMVWAKGAETVQMAVGIAAGIVIASEIVRLMMSLSRRRNLRRGGRAPGKTGKSLPKN